MRGSGAVIYVNETTIVQGRERQRKHSVIREEIGICTGDILVEFFAGLMDDTLACVALL